MAASMDNTLTKMKKRKMSKNKKKSWRKVDVTDVEEYLEDERLQKRTGGLVAEKPDDQLFYVDKTIPKTGPTGPTESAATRRKREAQSHLVEAEGALKVEPVRVKPLRSTNILKKLESGKKTLKEKLAEKQRQSAIQKRSDRRREKRALPVAQYDLWGESNTEVSKEDPHFLTVTKRRRVQPPRHYHEETSRVAKVEVPHPGSSYNPSYEDHQELLLKAHKVEEKKVLEEKRLHKSLDAKFPSRDQAPTEKSILEEMSAGLFDADSDDDDDTGGDVDRLSVNPPVRREDKKDERQRKKEKQKVQQEKKLQKVKSKQSKERDVFRLKSIKAEIKGQDKEFQRRANRKRKLAEEQPYTTKKLGRMKFVEPDMELKLSEELVGSLRQLKPEGHLLEDRFKSLQKRNIIEPRTIAKRSTNKRYRPKEFERKGHREITL